MLIEICCTIEGSRGHNCTKPQLKISDANIGYCKMMVQVLSSLYMYYVDIVPCMGTGLVQTSHRET